MKLNFTFFSLLALLLSISSVYGQDVLLKKNQQVSGFLSIEPMVSNFDGNPAFNQSASIAAILNQRFYIGAFSEAMLFNGKGGILEDIDCYEPDFGAAGLMFGTIIKPEKLVHFDLRAKLGLGALRLDQLDPPVILFDDFESDYEPVFVAHPSAGIEINISKFFKLNTHLGYRYIGNIDRPNFDSNALNGLTGQIGLVFGWFGQKKVKEVENDEERIRL